MSLLSVFLDEGRLEFLAIFATVDKSWDVR